MLYPPALAPKEHWIGQSVPELEECYWMLSLDATPSRKCLSIEEDPARDALGSMQCLVLNLSAFLVILI